MTENLKLMMWPSGNLDLQNLDLVVEHSKKIQNKPQFQPTTYTFTKLENGKKMTADSTSLTPPSWLLLDHCIAVIWTMFSVAPHSLQLSIDDFKWAYEFLKGIKNKQGHNPPDVKVCLREIQDRLINLYARLTSMKQEDFDEIAAAFGEKIIQDATTTYLNRSVVTNKFETKTENGGSSPPKSPLPQRRSFIDVTKNASGKRIAVNFQKQKFPILEEDFDPCEVETADDEEVEKYILSFLEDEKKEEQIPAKQSVKSLIPMKKKNAQTVLSEVVSLQDPAAAAAAAAATGEVTRKEKISKRVHCVAEMRSLKFQKSMKMQDTNGEEAAYSNLKAEIKRLSFNPNVSKTEIMKFLEDWRSGQVDRLSNELKRLSSIEEFMKHIKEEVKPNLRKNSHLDLNRFDSAKSNCLSKSWLS